jgi:hypothetical protein
MRSIHFHLFVQLFCAHTNAIPKTPINNATVGAFVSIILAALVALVALVALAAVDEDTDDVDPEPFATDVEVEVEVTILVLSGELAMESIVCDEFLVPEAPVFVSVTDELPVALLPKPIVLLTPDKPVTLAPGPI